MSLPTITIYDPSSNVVISNVAMTRVATGTYTYAYVTNQNAAAGAWESVITSSVDSNNTLSNYEIWHVTNNPAQVIINSITQNTVPNAAANITITDEGLSGYEYQYEWCVVANQNDVCGAPNFHRAGIAAEGQAFFLLMEAAYVDL